IDRLVGWRNFATTQPNNNFPNVALPPAPAFAANFRDGTAVAAGLGAVSYWKAIINSPTISPTIAASASGFINASTAQSPNGRSDQMFLSRQQLIAYRATTNFPASALQYLGTFLRESNAPSWKPSTPSAIN